MHYNNKEKRTTKTVEINSIELQKCNNGQRFKIDVITKHRGGGNRGNDVVQPPRMTVAALAEIVQSGFKSINTRLDKVETTLAEHGEAIADLRTDVASIKTELANVIRLNNLKR